MKKRKKWLDVSRTFAVIAIVSNHAVSRVFDNGIDQYSEFVRQPWLSQLFKAIITTFSWLGVPIFLMITGALMIGRKYESKDDIKKFYKKSWLPLLIVTEVWSFFGYIFITIQNSVPFNFEWIFGLLKTMLFIDKVEFGLMWYMNMIICLYPLIPIFSVFIKRFSLKQIRVPFFIGLWMGFIFPTISKYVYIFTDTNIQSDLLSTYTYSSYLLYIIIGYFISNDGLKKLKTRTICIGVTTTFILTVFLQFIGYANKHNLVTSYDSVGILIISICLFELFRRYCDNFYEKVMLFFTYMSNRAFAIYSIHIFFTETMFYYLKRKIVIYNQCVTTILYVLIPISCALIVIMLLEKSKLIKRHILMIKD